jgi:hypothetical protein
MPKMLIYKGMAPSLLVTKTMIFSCNSYSKRRYCNIDKKEWEIVVLIVLFI